MQFDIRKFDIYRKVPKDLTQPTKTGAVISIASVLFIIYLLLSEFVSFLSPELVSEVYVDDPVKTQDSIPVFLNISLLKLSCGYVGLDIQDDMGRHDVGFIENSQKIDIAGGGCRFETKFLINKVSGNFHVATHSSEAQPQHPNFAHVINELRFGSQASSQLLAAYGRASSFAPLNGRASANANELDTHDYFLKIVPSIVQQGSRASFPFQFTALYRSVTRMGHGGVMMPAIWFRYELAPVVVKYKERAMPLYHFLTQICAIIGGTFTVAGIIDSMIFTASEIVKKVELGKFT